MSDHDYWEQLAAGFALDALEPEGRADPPAHLATCAQCQELVDEHALVAAQLGSLAGDDVSPPPWSAIRVGVVGESQRRAEADGVVLRLRPRFATLAAAAAAVAVVGGPVSPCNLARHRII